MNVTGTVESVRYTRSNGNRYVSVVIGGRRLRYLSGLLCPLVKRGQTVTIVGMPMVGYSRVNVGGVTVTIHPSDERNP